MDAKLDIPIEAQEFCKEVAHVARKYKLDSFSGKFRIGLYAHLPATSSNEIEFQWHQGRHGEESGEIDIQTQVWMHGRIDENLTD